MDLVFLVSIGGLEKGRYVKTRVGKRTKSDSEPVTLNEQVDWYAEFCSGDGGFRRISERTTIQQQSDLNCAWARNVWGKVSYGINYYVVTEDEAKRLIEPHKMYED